MDHRNVDILPQHYTLKWRHHGPPKRWYPITTFHAEDGGSMDLRNVCVLPQHYTLKF